MRRGVIKKEGVEHAPPSTVWVDDGRDEDGLIAKETSDDVLSCERHLRVSVRFPWSQKFTSFFLLEVQLGIGRDLRGYT